MPLVADEREGAMVSDIGERPDVLEVAALRIIHPARGRKGAAVVAADDVNLRVGRGEIVGLVGESGSGKSSVAMAVAGLGRRDGGSISLLGRPVAPRRMRGDQRAEIQVVFQDPQGSLDPRQSMRSGLAELRALHPERTEWINDADLLERVGLDPAAVLDRYPHQISGGQAQRVCIARALLLRPALLVADEPTSGLDVSVQAQILRLLSDLSRQDGVAIVFISHDLSVVRVLCERVYVMLRGTIVEAGPVAEVFGDPRHDYTRRLLAAVPGRARAERSGVPVTAGETS